MTPAPAPERRAGIAVPGLGEAGAFSRKEPS